MAKKMKTIADIENIPAIKKLLQQVATTQEAKKAFEQRVKDAKKDK